MNPTDEHLLEVAWYLSKHGKQKPPAALGVNKLNEAIGLFYPLFGAGKTSEEFYNSLKNSRDRFDSWLSSVRRGWRNPDGAPAELSQVASQVMKRMNALSDISTEQRILTLISTDDSEQAQHDVSLIKQDKSLDETVKERLVAARLGQGEFRKNCLKLYPACPVTGLDFAPLLRASHIKPWSACGSASERLDPFNGMMLAAHIDMLFDQGWISFSNKGHVLISEELGESVVKHFFLEGKKIMPFEDYSYDYLEWHRRNIYRGRA